MLKAVVYARNCLTSKTIYHKHAISHLRYGNSYFSTADDVNTSSSTGKASLAGELDGKDGNIKVWSWVPPKRLNKDQVLKDNFVIPCVPGVYLTPNEVKAALISQGAEDVCTINLRGRLGNISEFVLGTGRSPRHLRKMAESIISAMKSRNVKQPKETEGIEGAKNDDWQLVDCNSFLVHLMLPATRKAIALEAHWSQEEMPTLPYCLNDTAYEAEFERLLDKYPCPKDYLKEDEEPMSMPSKVRKL